MKKTILLLTLLLFITIEAKSKSTVQQSDKKLSHYQHQTVTEWFSISITTGTYGVLGANLSFFTIRSKSFYWEIARGEIGGLVSGIHLNGKSMVGIPFYVGRDNTNEIRVGGGLSAGAAETTLGKGGVYAIFNLAFEVSYVKHFLKHLATQIGFSIDIPLVIDDSMGRNNRFPNMKIFAGGRF